MSKEELQRGSAQGHASSVPPRPASEPPRSLPSKPPSTDDIDTDWGAEQDAPPLAAERSVAPAPAAVTPPGSAPPPAAPVRALPRRSQTLIGISPPLRAAASDAAVAAGPAVASGVSEAAARERAPSARPAPLSQTLIGLAAPVRPASSAPPELEPAEATATPVVGSSIPAPSPSAAPSSLSTPAMRPPLQNAPPPPLRSSVPPVVAVSLTPAAAASTAGGALKPIAAAPPSAPETSSGFGRWLVVLAAAVVAVSGIGYRVLRSEGASVPAPLSAAASPAEPAAAAVPVQAVAAEPSPAAAASSVAAQPDTAPAPVAAPAASAVAAPATSAVAPAAAPAASAAAGSAPDMQRVTLKSVPTKARFFHYGKQIGVAPFVLELKPGERHAYEVGMPGYITRKVVVDGSQPEITVGLRSESR